MARVRLVYETEVPDEDISEMNDALIEAKNRMLAAIDNADSLDDLFDVFCGFYINGEEI